MFFVIGTSTRYGLDGPRIESRCGRDYPHPSKPVLGLTQPPIKWEMGLFWGITRPERGVGHSPPPGAEVKEIIELKLYPHMGLRDLL